MVVDFVKKTFIFDFDSTIFPGETLDEIIQFKLKDDPREKEKSTRITEICNQGMGGLISMEESLKRRLDIAAPDKALIEQYVQENKNRIETEMIDLLLKIQEKKHQLLIVSGGFEEWIKPLLQGIVPPELIHANKVLDFQLPLSFQNIFRRDKEQIIRELIHSNKSSRTQIIMIGDGATDFSVYENGISDQFIGTFYYVDPNDRSSVIEEAKRNRQLTYLDKKSFIKKILDYIQ